MAISNFYRGDTKKIYLEFKDKDDNPIDLTGAKVFFTLKAFPDLPDDEASLQKEVTNHTDAVNGETEIVIEPDDTNNLTPQTYYYDIQLVLSNGDVYTIDSGKLKILTDITRTTT